MPVEIRELHIKVTVNESGAQQNNRSDGNRGAEGVGSGTNREELVAECVEQMVKIMQNKRER